jgi:hypothetical protein
MFYTLDDEALAKLLMALSAMHAYHATRYNFSEPEGRQLAARHGMQQVESYMQEATLR